jgi:pimeloyl-ACP methyl ester carboxylesterase
MSTPSAASQVLTIDGLSVELSGPESGMPVIFGHSLLLDRRIFAPQVAELARDFRCINIDFRGHGQSAPPPRGFGIRDQANDYLAVLDRLGIERAAVVGLSMGGMAAMHLAVAHPERVSGLALLSTSADSEPRGARAKNMALAVMARLFGVTGFIKKQVAPLMFGERFRREHPEIVETWLDSMAVLDRKGLYRAVVMVTSRPAVGPRLAEIRVPTLVVTGDQDKAVPPARGRKIAETIPGAELRHLPLTGHIATLEEPVVTTKLIRVLLERAFSERRAP